MAISAQITGQWGALSLRADSPIAVTPATVVTLSVHGGASGVALELLLGSDNFSTRSTPLVVTASANVWVPITVTAAQLGALKSFRRLQLSPVGGAPTGVFSVDDLSIISTVATPIPVPPPPVPATPNPTIPAPPRGAANGSITINTSQLTPFSSAMRGTNAGSWEKAWSFADPTIVARTAGLFGNMRFPGGQVSQHVGWASCQLGFDIPGAHPCNVPAASGFAVGSDFIKLVRSTGTPDAIITMNINASAKENAALVAFFNGAVGDARVLGVDQKGADWKTVGYWAKVRSDSGSPDPPNLTIFEFGNETYGGKGGPRCMADGWEVAYSCDPSHYLFGLGTGAQRYDGYVATKALVRSLFPSVLLGVPIVDPVHTWTPTYLPYDREILQLGGASIDFLAVHEYMINGPTNDAAMLAYPQTHWTGMRDRLNALMDQFAGRRIPMYESEYGLYPVLNNDTESRTNWAMNGLVMTDSIGMLHSLGFVGANQFNLFSTGQGPNGNRYYGQLRNDPSFTRSPTYWGTVLWSKFGNQMAATTSTFDNATTLSSYGGRTADGQISLLVINKTTSAQTANIHFQGIAGVNRSVVDVATSTSLSDWNMSFNGVTNPLNNLSDAPSAVGTFAATTAVSWSFPPGSMTLLRFTPSG